MVFIKNHIELRSSQYLRKYKIFFIFGIILLCTQVYLYLSFSFVSLENTTHYQNKKVYNVFREQNSAENIEHEGLPKGTRQLKLPPDKKTTPNKFVSHNRTTRVKLDLSSLHFSPICEVTGREAISAITRAKTQLCKEYLANISCLNQQNKLYPLRIQSSCPHSSGFVDVPISIGCFQDDKISRLLPDYYLVLKNNSPAHCANICLQSGYPYAGVQYSVECFCGKDEPLKSKQIANSSCSMTCPGDSKHFCGGYLTIHVFSTGIKKFQPQIAKNHTEKINKQPSVRIAYLLTVNGRASRQIKRLINALYDPQHFFYIHVDARQDYLFREMLKLEKSCQRNNILVAKGLNLRHASIWGGASLLVTFLTSAQQMIHHFKNWDFLINLSESDFPIKTNARLIEFLSMNKGFNFVKSHGREVQRFLSKQGLDKTFVECEARMWRIGDRKLPFGIQIDGGSDWVALSRDFVEYVSNSDPDPLIKDLIQIFQYTLLPAESFFHTALRNSKFCDTYVDNNLHVTNWKRKLGCKCQYKAVVDWCGCSPNDFKEDDFNRIRNTAERNLFFARKFEPIIDQRIINKVEKWLYPNKGNLSLVKGYDMYWQSLYHSDDHSPPNDDALVTISNSLARIIYKTFGIENGIEVIETSVYYQANKFNGILIHARANLEIIESSTLTNDVPEEIEALIYLRHNFSTSKIWVDKIVSLSVSTDYDQKEQMFRNLISGIGSMSSPTLAYEFHSKLTLPKNFTILWVDPYGTLAEVNHIQIEESLLVGYVKPQLIEPLAIGEWSVFVISSDKLIARINFLVIPLTHWKNKVINFETAKKINHNASKNYHVSKNATKKWQIVLKPHIKINNFNQYDSIILNSRLKEWVDTFVSKYYKIGKICTVGKMNKRDSNLQKCMDTEWSSLSPDPKSDIFTLCKN